MNWQFKAVEFVARHLIRRPKLNGKTVGLSIGYVSTISHNLDGRIAVSEATKSFWQKKSPAEYRVIYNGIDTHELSLENPPSPRLPPSQTLRRTSRRARVILFAGRHDSRKGISDLIKAFHILRLNGIDNIRLKITGKGELTESLRELVKKLKLQKIIQFVGVLSRS
ncbi:MAG: glycosyltransferase, partial [Candidatus Curtissbacteria bacterium]|nr:glycosyltransferase [Candidatus Curtissbacteria bacterium]